MFQVIQRMYNKDAFPISDGILVALKKKNSIDVNQMFDEDRSLKKKW
tara:strand:+ start:341 stop:481 length:141 start_codon:yes stop_codon:yes gene_type:complete